MNSPADAAAAVAATAAGCKRSAPSTGNEPNPASPKKSKADPASVSSAPSAAAAASSSAAPAAAAAAAASPSAAIRRLTEQNNAAAADADNAAASEAAIRRRLLLQFDDEIQAELQQIEAELQQKISQLRAQAAQTFEARVAAEVKKTRPASARIDSDLGAAAAPSSLLAAAPILFCNTCIACCKRAHTSRILDGLMQRAVPDDLAPVEGIAQEELAEKERDTKLLFFCAARVSFQGAARRQASRPRKQSDRRESAAAELRHDAGDVYLGLSITLRSR